MRVPVSALRFCGSDFGAKESANPSVSRVETKLAPDPRKLAKLAVFCGSGDPLCVQTSMPENATYRPCSGSPTVSWLLGSVRTLLGFSPINTCIDLLGSKSNWLAAPRRPSTRRVTEPDADKVKVAPLKTRVPGPLSIGVEVIGWGPDPLSAVNEMPLRVLEESDVRRLVMSTFKNMKRLAVNVALGVPPEQLKTMSPDLSVIPSP